MSAFSTSLQANPQALKRFKYLLFSNQTIVPRRLMRNQHPESAAVLTLFRGSWIVMLRNLMMCLVYGQPECVHISCLHHLLKTFRLHQPHKQKELSPFVGWWQQEDVIECASQCVHSWSWIEMCAELEWQWHTY